MGKQISFYITSDDEKELIDYLRSTGDVVIFPNVMQKPDECFSDFLALDEQDVKSGNSCYLWNRSISPAPLLKYYKEKSYYCIDSMQSEVVQMRRAKSGEDELRMGRLYVETTFINANAEVYEKGKVFSDWYEHLAKWMKKNYKTLERSVYISERAAQLKDGGAKLGHYNF